jgi:NTE family protein
MPLLLNRLLLGLWAFVGCCLPSLAAASPPAERPVTALVLSGGGARGFAHVGVLKALEEARVPVDMVVGTSMGAIIGGLYASGMSPAELEREILAVDWNALFSARVPRPTLSQRQKEEDFNFSAVLQLGFRDGQFVLPSGAVSSRSLELLLRRYTLHTRDLADFDELPIPFRAVATDMVSGEAVLLRQGDLAAALRASMSVPGVFAPLEWEGRLLGDGGLVNNLPVDVARQMGADRIIAVNIGTPLASRDSLDSVIGITLQMINILTEQNVQRATALLTHDDLLLQPQLGNLTSASFDQAEELVRLGLRYGESVAASLERFALPPDDYLAWQAQRRLRHAALLDSLPQSLAFVQIEGAPPQQAQRLQRRLDVQPGTPLAADAVESDIKRLLALDETRRIDYRLQREPVSGQEGLIYTLSDNPAGLHQFRIGLDLRTDFQGLGDFNLRLSHTRRDLTTLGAQLRSRLELGATVSAGTEWFQPLGHDRQWFSSLYAEHELRKIEWFDSAGDPFALFRRRTSRIGVDLGWHLGRTNHAGDLRIGVLGARRQSLPDYVNDTAGFSLTPIDWTEAAMRLAWVTDQLDRAHFPTSGYRYTLDLQQGHYRVLAQKTDFVRWSLTAQQAYSHGPHTWNAYMRLASSSAVAAGAVDEYALGGFHNLSGYRLGQLAGNRLALLRLGYYQRLPYQPGLVRNLFAGGSLEAGTAWTDGALAPPGSAQRRWRLGSSLYIGADTGIGPLYLGIVHAPRGYTGLYFVLGRP